MKYKIYRREEEYNKWGNHRDVSVVETFTIKEWAYAYCEYLNQTRGWNHEDWKCNYNVVEVSE